MQNTLKDIKFKENSLNISQNSYKKSQKLKALDIADSSQKKIILHVPEQKEKKSFKNYSNDENVRIMTEIEDLEKKYSSMNSKISNLNIVDEDETLFMRKDLNEMQNLMGEFEEKNLAMHKQKFQTFIHKLLKKFHNKKKRLLIEMANIKKNFENELSLNKELVVKMEFLNNSYTKILADFEELQELKRGIEEDLLKYQKNEIVLNKEIEKLRALLNSKEIQLHFFDERNLVLEDEKKKITDENRHLFAKCSKFESENSLYRLEIEKIKENYSEKVIDLKNDIIDIRKNNKTLLEELIEIKKENFSFKIEIDGICKERDHYKEDYRELEILLKEKLNEINMLKNSLNNSSSKTVIQEVPFDRIIEKPIEIEKTVFVENREMIEEFHSLQKAKASIEQELFFVNENFRRIQMDYQEIHNELDQWKKKYMEIEGDLRGFIEERKELVERNLQGDRVINELREKIGMMMNDIHCMQMNNQEKNADIAKYIESLISQNQYLEDLVVSKK